MLAGSNSVFKQGNEADLAERLEQSDIHLTGPLYGKAGALATEAAVGELEHKVLSAYPDFLAGLEQEGLKAERRSLRSIPQDFDWSIDKQQITLSFSLDSGCFATAVVRELVNYRTSRVD